MHVHELEDTLPNGFQRAELERLVVDVERKVVSLVLDIDVSVAAEPPAEIDHRRAELRLEGARVMPDSLIPTKPERCSLTERADDPRVAMFFLEEGGGFLGVEHDSASLVWDAE